VPPLPDVDAVKCEMINFATGSSRPWVNIFHLAYTPTGGITGADLASLAADFDADYETYLQSFCSVHSEHSSSKYTDLGSVDGLIHYTSPVVAGGSVGTLAPLSLAAVVSWGIARRYRGGHGRTYLSALTTAQAVGPQDLDPTFAGNLAASAATFVGRWTAKTVGAKTYTLAIISYRTNNAPRVTPLPQDVLSAIVHERIDSQRRRLGKELV